MLTSLALAVLALSPQDPTTGELAGRAARVLAYKDGHSLVSLRLAGTADAEGRLSFELPEARLVVGAAWIEGERAPRTVRAAAREVEVTRPCRTLFDALRANVGREVTLQWLPGGRGAGVDQVTFAGGRVERVVASVDPTPLPRGAAGLQPERDGLVFLRRGDGVVQVLPTEELVGLVGDDLATELVETEPGPWVLDLEVEPGATFACDLHFLARGIEWRAVYRLTGDLEGEDELALAYELSNELVDLAATPVHLVAGEPNFTYDDVTSVLSALGPLPGQPEPVWGQQLVTNVFSNAAPARGLPAPTGPEPEPRTRGDLTRLPLGAVTLDRGERALVRTTELSVPVEHLYTVDLDVRRGSENGVEVRDAYGAPDEWEPAYRGGFVRERRSKAWHRLELRNTGDAPLTSGPVLVSRALPDGPFPLAQERLGYTPPGDTAEVPLELALGLETEFWEESRPARVGQEGETVVEGRLTLTNRVGETVRVRARVGLGGRVTVLEGDARVLLSPGRDADWTGTERGDWRWRRELNPHAEVEWRLELAPGASATLVYESRYDARPRNPR